MRPLQKSCRSRRLTAIPPGRGWQPLLHTTFAEVSVFKKMAFDSNVYFWLCLLAYAESHGRKLIDECEDESAEALAKADMLR